MRLVLTSEKYGIQELDINQIESSTILYQKLQYNTNNPTQYVTDHSLNITLPMTSNNMKVLNYYALLDSTQHMAEIPVLVMDGDNYICPGTLYINNIGLDHIDCTLQSDLHTYFNKMLNTTFWYDRVGAGGKINDMGMEILDNMLDDGYNINKDTIYESWNTVPNPRAWQNQQTLNPIRRPWYNPNISDSHSIIAWAPTLNNQSKDFVQDQVIIGGWRKVMDSYYLNICNGTPTVPGVNVPIFGKRSEPRYMDIADDNKAIVDAKIKDGITERQWNQFRSYHQKPTVYVNQLWKKYMEISNRYTGYSLILDEGWFNTNNTRYTDLVYTLPNINTDPVSKSLSTSLSYNSIEINMYPGCFGSDMVHSENIRFFGAGTDGSGNIVSSSGGYTKLNVDLALQFRFTRNSVITRDFHLQLNEDSYIEVQLRFINNDDPSDIHTYDYIINNNGYNYGRRKGIPFGNPAFENGVDSIVHEIRINDDFLINTNNDINLYRGAVTIITHHFNDVEYLFTSPDISLDMSVLARESGNPMLLINGPMTMKYTKYNRSFRLMEMKDFFPKNYCPFNILMQYCKLFNLVWLIDDMAKTVTVCTREKAFREGKVYNWDNAVDRSKDIIFSPFSWDSRYITFNYKDASIDKLKEYKEQYEVNYGDLKVKTSYDRNTTNKNLLGNGSTDSIFPSSIASRSYYPMFFMCDLNPPQEYDEVFIDNRGSSDTWGQFYFRNNNTTWDTSGFKNYSFVDVEYKGGPTVTPGFRDLGICITDDTPFQMDKNLYTVDMTVYGNNSRYMRLLIENSTSSDTRPVFSVYDRNWVYNCWMGKPAALYYNTLFISLNLFNRSKDIYTDRWKRIIEEQYDKNNKLVTLYVHLTPIEYINLTCFDFVVFEHILYSVFKVEGYNEKEQLAKVQLLQVTDYDAYTRNDEV